VLRILRTGDRSNCKYSRTDRIHCNAPLKAQSKDALCFPTRCFSPETWESSSPPYDCLIICIRFLSFHKILVATQVTTLQLIYNNMILACNNAIKPRIEKDKNESPISPKCIISEHNPCYSMLQRLRKAHQRFSSMHVDPEKERKTKCWTRPRG
jgi:hypothetical protein